jgi:hypothetical protein
MAAKEETAVLKFLKKNPSQEALDISFGIDIDESLVKETLIALEGKGQVEQKDVGGRPQWSLAAPKPKPAPVPVPKADPVASNEFSEVEKPSKATRAAAVADDEDESAPKGGVSKGFVLGVSLVVLLVALGGGWVLGGMQASAASNALVATDLKNMRDSTKLDIMKLNVRIDGLESQIRDLKAAPAPKEEPAAKKPAAKPAKKKKK